MKLPRRRWLAAALLAMFAPARAQDGFAAAARTAGPRHRGDDARDGRRHRARDAAPGGAGRDRARAASSLRAGVAGGVRLPRSPVADRRGPDDLAAVHRRADDGPGRARARHARARGRDRIGLPGGGAGGVRRARVLDRDRGVAGSQARARCWPTSAIATSTCASATAMPDGPTPRRSTRSSSPPRPSRCRDRWWTSWKPGGRMVIPVGATRRHAGPARHHQGRRRQGGHAPRAAGALRAADASLAGACTSGTGGRARPTAAVRRPPYFRNSGEMRLGRNRMICGNMIVSARTPSIGISMMITSFSTYISRTLAIAQEIIRHNP